MQRLTIAPNLAIATLWADMLRQAGFDATVQRAYASSIAGEMPPDQCLPEVWIMDDAQVAAARALLPQLREAPWRYWVCPSCHEHIDGPFDQCWSCGTAMPV